MADDATRVDISRLQRRRDFLRVAAERQKWVTPGLILQAAPMPRGDLNTGRAQKSLGKAPDARTSEPLDVASLKTESLDMTQGKLGPVLNEVGPSNDRSSSEPHPAPATVPAPPLARVGFTVSKKVGNSVQRNRARRRLRAAADEVMATCATPHTDYVIIGRTQTLDRPFEDLVKDLRKALSRVMTAPKSAPYQRGSGKGGKSGKGAPHRGKTASAPVTTPSQVPDRGAQQSTRTDDASPQRPAGMAPSSERTKQR